MNQTIDKRELLACALDRSGFGGLLRKTPCWNGLLVLNYHRIGHHAGSPFDWNLWSATEDDFELQVAFLARNFDLIGLDELDDVLGRRAGRFVMITFDDGYRDNYDTAFPILQAHGVPATFFLATGYLDRPRVPWWDEVSWMVRRSQCQGIAANAWTIEPVRFDRPHRCAAIHRLLKTYMSLESQETGDYLEFLADVTGSGRCPDDEAAGLWMDWNMVRRMRRAGMSFGGHTVSHPILSRSAPEGQDREIETCRNRLEAELREPVTAFSYPVGKPWTFTEVTRACVQAHGFRYAFSYYGGYCRFGGTDDFDIPRIAVERDVSHSRLRSVSTLPQVFA